MKERDDEIPLGDYIQLDSVYWGGVRHGVRGRGAKEKHPLVTAIYLNDEGDPISMHFSAVDGFNKVEITNWAKIHLMPKSLVTSDSLACFIGVKDAEMLHLAVVTGGGATSVEWPYLKWANTVISNVKNSMHAINQGIYLAIWQSSTLSLIGGLT